MSAADWDALKVEYATTQITMRALAAQHGINASVLMRKAAQDGWTMARTQHARTVQAKAMRRVESRKVAKLVGLQRSADKMVGVIEGVLGDPDQFRRHLVSKGSEGAFDTVERMFDKVDTKALRDMVAAIKDMTVTMRNLYGLLTEPERSAMDIAAARLRLDERKASVDGPDDTETGVVMLAEVTEEDDG